MVTICVGPGTVVVVVTVDGGSTMVVREVEMEVETVVTVLSIVLVTTEMSTRVTVGPSTV